MSTVQFDLELLRLNMKRDSTSGSVKSWPWLMSSIFQFPLQGLLPDKFIVVMLQQTVQSLTITGTS